MNRIINDNKINYFRKTNPWHKGVVHYFYLLLACKCHSQLLRRRSSILLENSADTIEYPLVDVGELAKLVHFLKEIKYHSIELYSVFKYEKYFS